MIIDVNSGMVKKIVLLFIKRPGRAFHLVFNKLGNKKKCYVCKNTFDHFKKYGDGSRNINEFIKAVQFVGSDVDNFGCMYCGSMDRERHLFMFFDELKVWEQLKNASILHFAPERCLSKKIKTMASGQYIMADLYPNNTNIQKIDVCNIPYNDNTFDFIICNHVLEHVKDYNHGIREIFRVLKHSGTAILQTPYSTLFDHHFWEESINTDELRAFFYGEVNHLRLFSRAQLFTEIEEAGFILKTIKSESLFNFNVSKYFGVNNQEELIRVIKP